MPALLLTLLVQVACSPGKPDAPAPDDKSTRITTAQMEELRRSDGQTPAPALWRLLATGPDSTLQPAIVHWLSGNLDDDPADEAVIWYKVAEEGGTARWFDRQATDWVEVGTLSLDFWHGENPPRFDTVLDALAVYSYGWGSGYGAEMINFYRYRDGISSVFYLLESENLSMIGSGALRHIAGRYEALNDTGMVAHYTYEITCNDEGKHHGERVFYATLNIPYSRPETGTAYRAHPPTPLSAADFDDSWTGEESLDPYFEPEIEKIRRAGPAWKKEALGAGPKD
jgi:hypothetical protein